MGKFVSAGPPKRGTNAERRGRGREHLTPREVDALMEAARSIGRHVLWDATMILMAYRHALRVSELVALCWDQVDLEEGLLHVHRRKNGCPVRIRCVVPSCALCVSSSVGILEVLAICL